MPPEFIHRIQTGAKRTLVLLHGTGGTEEDLLELGSELDPEATLLAPRGKVLERGMPRFFRRLAEGVFDEADLIARAGELAEWLVHTKARHNLGELRAVGYSNGANIASAVAFLHPGVFSRLCLLRPMVPLTPAKAPDLTGVRVLLCFGEFDPIVPAENAKRLAGMYESFGADLTVHVEPTGHGLTQGDIAAATAFMK